MGVWRVSKSKRRERWNVYFNIENFNKEVQRLSRPIQKLQQKMTLAVAVMSHWRTGIAGWHQPGQGCI